MALRIQDIVNIVHEIAPFELAESWDNIGLLTGNPLAGARSILVTLDPVADLIEEARSRDANVIITHHPIIFHPLKSLRTDHPIGNFLSLAVQNNIHVIACHTNLDAVDGGVSDILARRLGLTETTPLIPAPSNGNESCGLGRIGRCPTPLTPADCVEKIRKALDAPWLLEAGSRPELVKKIAVCGGSCSEYAETALQAGADLFLTAEIKHSTARWAEETGFWVIDGGHFATEHPIVQPLQKQVQQAILKRNQNNKVYTVLQKPPLTIV